MRRLLAAMFVVVILGGASARADQRHAEALSTMLTAFEELDTAWRAYPAQGDVSRERREALAALFRTHAKSLSKAASGLCPEFREVFEEYGNIFRQVAKRLSNPASRPEHEYDTPTGQTSFLPMLTQGILLGLLDEAAGAERLTPEEAARFRSAAARSFGDRIRGDKTINGDTPFAQSISLIDGFLAVRPGGPAAGPSMGDSDRAR